MPSIEDRIAQWEKMAQEAPDDMAFFSLGSAYREGKRLEEAEQAFARAVEMNPGMSRAYQMRGQTLLQLKREEEAAEVLEAGYKVSSQRGDVMPQKAIGSLLTQKLGRELPEAPTPDTSQSTASAQGSEDSVVDRRTGQAQPRLPDPPMRGPTGRFIYDHFGQDTWRQWIGMGTKVINELKLDFSNPRHQDVYEQHMLEWLGVTPEEVEQYDQQHQHQPPSPA